jgi:hypothetical protein
MKPKTRDNVIYLAVGLGIAALVCIDAFYSLSRNREMWMPSWFAARVVYTTALIWYFAIREIRKRFKTKFFEMFGGILFITLIHVGLAFYFRQAIDQVATLSFAPWATLEGFGLVWSLLQVFRYPMSIPSR